MKQIKCEKQYNGDIKAKKNYFRAVKVNVHRRQMITSFKLL